MSALVVALDVQYEESSAPGSATTAAVGFRGWADASPALECVLHRWSELAPYEPGAFYKRELPFLLDILAQVEARHALEAVVVDGHAWLRPGEPGLGARLHEALGGRAPVVGVAKSAYEGGVALPVLRGDSKQPLFVSAAGMGAQQAAELVRGMHGPHRLPALLLRVDQLARGIAQPDPAKALAP